VIKAGIVGGTGYTGAELLRILATHKHVEVSVITSRAEAGRRVDDLFPSLRGVSDLLFVPPNTDVLLACDGRIRYQWRRAQCQNRPIDG